MSSWHARRRAASALGIARNQHDVPILAEASRDAGDRLCSRRAARRRCCSSRTCISTVHRRVPLDLVVVPMREGGKVAGLSIHAGLWTSAALDAPPERRAGAARRGSATLEAKFGFDPKGHTGKALTHALTALPHDLIDRVRRRERSRIWR